MYKLVTVKNRITGSVNRFSESIFDDMKLEGAQIVQDWHKVPKKLYKRQQRDLSRTRSKRKPNAFGSKLSERLAKQYGSKSIPTKKN